MLEIAHHRLAYVKVVEQLQGHAGVLRRNEIDLVQRFDGARREVAEVADRCSDKIQLSAHVVTSLW